MVDSIVASMRNFGYRKGQHVWITRRGKRICKAIIVDVYENNEENRRKLLPISGFENVKEWVEAATKLHRKMPKYIVVVKKK